MSQKQIKITIVNQKDNQNSNNESAQAREQDPLVQELKEMKITANLIKQINFNSTVNKFQYLEQLLSQQYASFDKKVTLLSSKQKQLVVSKIKQMHKDVHKISTQMLKQKQNPNSLLANKSSLLDLHKKAQSVIQTKKSSQKFLKLSEGMLNAVFRLEKELDDHVTNKIESLSQKK